MAITDQITSKLPSVSLTGVGHGIAIFLGLLLVGALALVIGYMIILHLRFNKKIIIMREIPGYGLSVVGRDTAMAMKIGDGGDEVLYLRKRKLFRPSYGKEVSLNTYAFAIDNQGYWHNVSFKSIDKAVKEINLELIDRDVGLMNVAIRKNNAHRFDQKNWLKENIGILVSIGAIIIVLIFMWLLADKYLTIGSTAKEMMDTSIKAGDQINGLLGKMDAICAGGKGYVQVPAA